MASCCHWAVNRLNNIFTNDLYSLRLVKRGYNQEQSLHHSAMFLDMLVLLAAAIVVVAVFKRFNTSAILGYLTAGMILGPAGLALIKNTENLEVLAEFGVVFLLFMIGLEFSVARLKALLRYVVGLGGLQVTLTTAVIAFIVIGFRYAPGPAVIIGGGLALSSTAFVLQLLSERGESDTQHGKIALAVLLFQDLAIVPLLILLTVIADADTSFIASLGIAFGEAAVALGVVYILGRVLLRPLYRMIARANETDLIIATTFLLIFGIGWFLSLYGVSMALGGFLAGLLLSESEFRHQIEADIKLFKGILLGLFFMTVGMTINIQLLVNELSTLLAIVIGILLLKSLMIAILARLFGLETAVALRVGLLLSQGGEFGFVLFLSAGQLGILSPEVIQILLTSIALTMALTPYLAMLGEKISLVLIDKQLNKQQNSNEFVDRLNNHAIIIGFGRVGQTISLLLKETNLPVLALDLDIDRIKHLKGKENHVFYGDAKRVSVLRSMGIERAQCVIITIDETMAAQDIIHAIHHVKPDLKIYVRARDVDHVIRLEESEQVNAVPEAVEGSLQLGALVLKDFGIQDKSAQDLIAAQRQKLYHSKLEQH